MPLCAYAINFTTCVLLPFSLDLMGAPDKAFTSAWHLAAMIINWLAAALKLINDYFRIGLACQSEYAESKRFQIAFHVHDQHLSHTRFAGKYLAISTGSCRLIQTACKDHGAYFLSLFGPSTVRICSPGSVVFFSPDFQRPSADSPAILDSL